ncbi:beta subunit of N-acylethanolamine-hydrolyzing acid amidase-domain-containing protein [Penicillium macrosclerotiorum]|uniref:beta subunit of N-acylethanolamine-hydrolyzing acid amidase-domain-containing protein n=1 Tax=Penicillium macrosclerotiorum TaxID=303699 RepID=UPI002547380F|nr:beta subunit of N-acylethanolamine-hydrolyzing acid amidase-domain-containing protein [Penicillium macrosclerotiorum]KAJ5689245.1 beta subunit of N-acylethanolamine-hydrolyzing acid amidase-domain-containing protein [Penicillium macrosclerotiorum]
MESFTDASEAGTTPPIFQIDLALPPAERYVALATIYRERMRALRGMFDELVTSVSPKIPVKGIHWLARMSLRRLYTDEETAELQGISRTTDIDLYLLICLNTVLDLLMGCTSGGVRTINGSENPKMLHFRTLDWGMDPLRNLIVQLEFVHGDNPRKVLATSITYVGFVGVLTGVRQGLSASLNFRPVHDTSRNWAFYFNHLLVLLGQRQSISSLLRECILSRPSEPKYKRPVSTLDEIIANVPSMPTTAAYLIFSDGERTAVMEKDHRTAVVRSSTSFIVVTNNDQHPDSTSPKTIAADKRKNHAGLSIVASNVQAMADLIEDSNERRECLQEKWTKRVQEAARAKELNGQLQKKNIVESKPATRSPSTRSSVRLRKKREEAEAGVETHRTSERNDSNFDSEVAIKPKEAISWLTTYPIVNEETHYATVMDPLRGKIKWARMYFPDDWVEVEELETRA